ncbi:MAG: galactose ABC transporter substrate-binding protein [Christensenellales bacterium]|nr:galactose ABC transporter substrate-binding protein [Christensenellales bacterium]
MKKLIAMALALAMCLTMVCGVASAEEAVVSWYTFGDVYLTSVRTALDAAFAEKGINVTDKDSNANQQTQTDDINTALVTGANAIVINLVESGAIGTAENLMNTVAAQGVPAVFFNRAVSTDDAEAKALFESYDKSVFIGTKFEEAGMMQGTMIGEYVLEHYDEMDLNGDGVISYVMFKGDEANQEAILRTKYGVENADAVLTAAGKPALQYYDANATTKYLVDMNGTWSNTASFEYMSTILAQYNEANKNMVELVICNNDDMALGAINALTNVGYNTGVEGDKVIPVFGVDATDAAKELIAAGRMVGTIKQDAVGMADAVATITANLIAGKDKFEGLNEHYNVIDGWMVTIPYAVYTGE